MTSSCERQSPQQVPAATVGAPQAAARSERVIEGPGFALRLSLAALPNLTYHLDCLTGTVFCSSAAYRALWNSLGLTADDEAALARWKHLRTRYADSYRADADLAAAPLLLPAAWIELGERQRIAARRASSLNELEETQALLTDDATAHELRTIAARFEPRFQRYWQSSGQAAGAAYFKDLAELLSHDDFLKTLARLARFDGHRSDVSTREYRLQLMVLPQAGSKGSRAFQMESDFEVEAQEGGRAVDAIDVIAHELCHALLYHMPVESKLALVDAFMRSDDPLSLVDYGLFDEALATSIGNGIVWRHFHANEDFEAHRARNFRSLYQPAAALAVALLPRLEALLAGDSVAASPAFVRTLAEAARASYREHGPRPIDYLHSHVLVSTPVLAAAANKVRDAAFAGFPYLRELPQFDAQAKAYLQQHPELSVAIFLPSTAPLPELLTALGMDPHRSSELQDLVTQNRGIVYAMRRTRKAQIFTFIASDETTGTELADAFIALNETKEGALIELKR